MTAVSEKFCFGVLDDTVDKYNNTYHDSIKMGPIDLSQILTLNAILIVMLKILNLKQDIM